VVMELGDDEDEDEDDIAQRRLCRCDDGRMAAGERV